MYRPHRIGWLLATAAIMALVVGVAFITPPADAARSAKADDNGNCGNPRVLPPQSHPYGKSYGEWSVAAWQWVCSAPLDQHPGLDETGAYIDYGQSGPVWFLAPNFGGMSNRYGEIPQGKALFISLIGFESSAREGYGTTEEDLRAVAASVIDGVENLTCEVDGVPIEGLSAYRFQTPYMFSLTVPEDNVFDLWGVPTPAGTYFPSVADGYCILLAPLPRGEHTIHFAAEIPLLGFWQAITFHLQVVAPGEVQGPEVLNPAYAPAPTTEARSWSSVKALYR
jgi:hypothetical protein